MTLLAARYRSDARLIQRILNGDRDLFGILVSRYTRSSYAVAYAHLGNTHDAEDTTQEAFLRAFQDLNRLDDPARFGNWLLSIVRHISIDRLRRVIRERRVLEESDNADASATPDPGRAELHALLRRRVDELKPEYREALSLHYFAGKSAREIAELLGESRESIKKRLQRAREALSVALVAELDDVLHVRGSDIRRIEHRTTRAVLAAPAAWELGRGPGTLASPIATSASASSMPMLGAITVAALVAVATLLVNIPSKSGNDSTPGRASNRVGHAARAALTLPADDVSLDQGQYSEPAESRAKNAASERSRAKGGIVGRLTMPRTAAVRVTAERIDWEKHETPPAAMELHQTQVDSSGQFMIRGLRPGFYVVIASGDGLMGVGAATVVGDEAQPLALDLIPAAPLDGRIQYADGRPAAGAWVYPREWIGEKSIWSGFSTGLRVQTNAAGEFRFPALWRGDWRLTVKAAGAPTLETGPLSGHGGAVEITLARGGSIQGSVVDVASGEPAAGVHIVVPGIVRRDRFETITGADGAYLIAGMLAGDYTVLIFDPHLIASGPLTAVHVDDDATVAVPVIQVTEGGSIVGRVTDAETGEGIGGAEVSVDRAPVGSVVTDASGHYVVGGLVPDRYDVRVTSAPGYVLTFAGATRRAAVNGTHIPAELDFTLERGDRVFGRVIRENGAAVPGAAVDLNTMDGTRITTLITGFDGAFAADDIGARTPVLLAATCEDGASPQEGPYRAGNATDWPCVLRVQPATDVAGFIVDPRGEPLAAWQALALPVGAATIPRRGDAASDGRFRIATLTYGTYDLVPVPPGADVPLAGTQPVRVRVDSSNAVDGIRLVSHPGLSISGHVQGSVQPAADALVEAVGAVRRTAQTDRSGNYILHGLPDGLYRIHVSHATCCSADREDIPAGSTGIDFQLVTRGRIYGRAVDARTNTPIEAFQIGFAPGTHPCVTPEAAATLAAVKHQDGVFVLDWVDAGEVTLFIRTPGYVDAVVPVDVPPDDAVSGVLVALQRGERLAGRVVTMTGGSVRGAELWLHACPDRVAGALGAAAQTDARGHFVLDNLPSQGAVVWVTHPEYAATDLVVEPRQFGTSSLRVVMAQGGAIAGRIVSDEPLPAVSVVLTDGLGLAHSLHLDNEGMFRSPPLQAGEYLIEASIYDSSGRATRTIACNETVRHGETTTLEWHWPVAQARLHGVLDATASDIENIAVWLEINGDWGAEIISVSVNSDGSFESAPAPAGPAIVVVEQWLDDGASTVFTYPCALSGAGNTYFEVSLPPASDDAPTNGFAPANVGGH